jgi:hypothetical protein
VLALVSAPAVHAQTDQSPDGLSARETCSGGDAESLIDWTPEQIRARPELRDLQLAESQEKLPAILDLVGKRVATFFDNFPNASATEDVVSGSCGSGSEDCAATFRAKYQYMLVWRSAGGERVLAEYRADKKGRPIDSIELLNHGTGAPMLTYGFAAAPLMHFHWQNRASSRFRYFGRQILDGKETEVVGFAEDPAEYCCPTTVGLENREASVFVQGLAWIDATSYHILRIRTFLLAPQAKLGLEGQTTRVDYGAIQLPETSGAYWLPVKAVVDVLLRETSHRMCFRNIHRYSQYQLFRVETRIGPTVIAPPAESLPQLTPPGTRSDTWPVAEAPTLIDWTPEQVRARRELRGLQSAENQAALPMILREVGDRVAAFFNSFPNTTSTEEVQSGPCSPWRENCAVTFKAKYQYLLIGRNADGQRAMDEYRADKKGRPIDYQPDSQRLAHVPILTSGFAAAPLLHFHPQSRTASHFRYFGRQRLRGEVTDVVGFAEIPGKYCCPTKYGFKDKEATLSVQGLAWADGITHQILRIQTELVAPRLDLALERQTTRIDYSSVRLPEIPTAFWLPTNVVVDIWLRRGLRRLRIRNTHHYSHYKLFRVESRISPVLEK